MAAAAEWKSPEVYSFPPFFTYVDTDGLGICFYSCLLLDAITFLSRDIDELGAGSSPSMQPAASSWSSGDS